MDYHFENTLLIIKVGTNVLATIRKHNEKLNHKSFRQIGRQIDKLSKSGYHVILVSSGAITAGVVADKLCRVDVNDTPSEQRYAARGWDIIVQRWKTVLGRNRVSSTLLTKREINSAKMKQKLLQALGCCLNHGDIFVVNENDCLSDDEIKFGDNDTLAAALAEICSTSGMFKSTKLVLLTNKPGLNKIAEDDSTIIRTVDDISTVEKYAGTAMNGHSRGGMKSKVKAARAATKAGVETFIASGFEKNAIERALKKETGTFFKKSYLRN